VANSASISPGAESSAGDGPNTFWPLFDLVVRTPRLELRLPREEEFAVLVALADRGVHDSGTMPFFVPWTDLEPTERARATAQWLWGHRASWSVHKWTFTGAAFVDGEPIGMQDMAGEHFEAVRSIESGSWLGRDHQGRGLGREMREAMLHLAFEGLGAEEALSGAFEDNAASLATSRAIGYDENGEARGTRRDGWGRTVRFRLARDAWAPRRRDDIEIVGLERCLDMFLARHPLPAPDPSSGTGAT
jgi:RimJ/RimL family protein N-acetyltransferase